MHFSENEIRDYALGRRLATNGEDPVRKAGNMRRGLLGEQRVREAVPTAFRGHFTPGCWLVSSYAGARTSRALLVPHIIDIGSPLPTNATAVAIPPSVMRLGELGRQLGIDAYYCIPFHKPIPAVAPTMRVRELRQRCIELGIAKPTNKTALLARLSEPVLQIEWAAVQLNALQTPPPVALSSVLLTELGYSASRVGEGMFRQEVPPTHLGAGADSIDQLSSQRLNDVFWQELLWWRTKRLISEAMADVDGFFFGQQVTYMVEVKSKTRGTGERFPPYFGLDATTIAKMGMFAANAPASVHGLYLVEEVVEVNGAREPQGYHAATFRKVFQDMNLVPLSGGKSGWSGGTTVFQVPLTTFRPLDAGVLAEL